MSMTVAQVAKHLSAGESLVLSFIRGGELRAFNVARSATAKRPSWRISAEALAEFEASRTPSAPQQPTPMTPPTAPPTAPSNPLTTLLDLLRLGSSIVLAPTNTLKAMGSWRSAAAVE